jgi:chromosome segregation ATPase
MKDDEINQLKEEIVVLRKIIKESNAQLDKSQKETTQLTNKINELEQDKEKIIKQSNAQLDKSQKEIIQLNNRVQNQNDRINQLEIAIQEKERMINKLNLKLNPHQKEVVPPKNMSNIKPKESLG